MSRINTGQPGVSVILPVHNAAKTVKVAVNSVLNQTARDLELIIVDDGSNDSTPDLLDGISDGRIRVVRNDKNLGISRSLNRGLKLANGQFIARMDADDVSHPRRFERQMDFLNSNSAISVCGTWVRDARGSGKVWRYPSDAGMVAATLLFASAVAHPTAMWRSSHPVMKQLSYDPDYDGVEDYELWLRVVQEAPLANLPEVLLDYRMHDAAPEKEVRAAELIARLHARQLVALGIVASPEHVRLHGAVARGDWTYIASHFHSVLPWLQQLESNNAQLERVPARALRGVVAERYFKICVLSSRHGIDGWRRFQESGYASALRGQWMTRARLLLRSLEIAK